MGQGRLNVLDQFATCGAFRALAGTVYREADWLIADQLGTPRMIANKSGSLSSVKRHDYLPFGEELSAGTGGRTTTQGYTVWHEHFRLVEHWLGNVASIIGELRRKLEQVSENYRSEYPILTTKVIYNGSHSGDFLVGEEVVRLRDEIARLRKVETAVGDSPRDDLFSKLEDLIEASLKVSKPIFVLMT